MGYEFKGVVNETVNGDRAVVWWRVANSQNRGSVFLKRTSLLKEDSTWLAAEDVKISESYVS